MKKKKHIQISVPVNLQMLDGLDAIFKKTTPGSWTVTRYETPDRYDPTIPPSQYIQIDDGRPDGAREEIAYFEYSKQIAADFDFIASSQRAYPLISCVLRSILNNEIHSEFYEAQQTVNALDGLFAKTTRGQWEVFGKEFGIGNADPVIMAGNKYVCEMCAGETCDQLDPMKDALFAADFHTLFAGIKMEFYQFSLKQSAPASVMAEPDAIN